MVVHLTREATFSAAHACRVPGASEEENRRLFGPAGRVHGHNYRCRLTLKGPLDPSTGMVVNLTTVKEALEQALERFQNAWIDRDHPAFAARVSTTENLALYLWQDLAARLRGMDLVRIQVAESPTLQSEYTGMPDRTVFVTRAYDFSAAHRLHSKCLSDEENRRVFGKCNNPAGHGHNYGLEVTLQGRVDERTGTAVDLGRLDAVVEERVLKVLDHRNLNQDLPEFAALNPTSEHLAQVIWGWLEPELGPALYRVRLQETARNVFEVYGEQ